MNFLTLETLKKYLRLDEEDNEEDALLEAFGDAGEEAILKYIDRTPENVYDVFGGLPRGVEVAMMMIAADLYKNRESTMQYTPVINPTMVALIKPYQKTYFGADEGANYD